MWCSPPKRIARTQRIALYKNKAFVHLGKEIVTQVISTLVISWKLGRGTIVLPEVTNFARHFKTAAIKYLQRDMITLHACCHFSHVWLFATLCTTALQPPLEGGFSRQEYWSGLSCSLPGDLPDAGIKPVSWTHVSYVSCIGRWVLYR